MSATEDYKKARLMLRHLNEQTSKVTMDAKQRIAAHSIREQLQMHCAALEREFGRTIPDQADIDFALNSPGFEGIKTLGAQGHDKGWDK